MVINKEKNFISAVVYVNNDEKYIKVFLKSLADILSKNFEKYEIICVNDCSVDNSIDIIKEFSSNINIASISVLNMSYYQGIELAMNAGRDLAIGDFVFEFDNVFVDYDINTIMSIYNRSLKGFDIVSAAPKKVDRLSSRIFYKLFNKFSNSQYKLRTEAFRILSRRAINRVNGMSTTIPYRKVMYSNCGLKIDTISYDRIKQATYKKDKNVLNNRKNVATDSLILFTDLVYKLTFVMAISMILVTIFTAVYTLTIYFGGGKPVEGWTTIMLFLSVSLFGVFSILAILIKYISILMELTFKKQKYAIESIEKITM